MLELAQRDSSEVGQFVTVDKALQVAGYGFFWLPSCVLTGSLLCGQDSDDDDGPDVLSDIVLILLSSPLLGPSNVQQLTLNNHQGINRGIAALAGGRFPGKSHHICALAPV